MQVHSGIQSVLDPAGPQAAQIAAIAWVLFIGGAVVFLVVMALAACALLRGPARCPWLAREGVIVGGGIVFPAVTLTALLVYSFFAAAAMAVKSGATPLRVEIVGEQWWWRIHYLDEDGEIAFATANELHLPLGRPIELALKSADVIHSFWLPNVAGKLDMIPGRVNRLRFTVDRAGVYRGQCAEYCGGPHGRMAFYAVVKPAEEFDRWRAAQMQPAASPGARHGEGAALFHARGCGVCHALRGTSARGERGPDLTHVGSRLSIGAGTLHNNAGALAAWIAGSQHVKPENLMPSFAVAFTGEELRAVTAYLEHLK